MLTLRINSYLNQTWDVRAAPVYSRPGVSGSGSTLRQYPVDMSYLHQTLVFSVVICNNLQVVSLSQNCRRLISCSPHDTLADHWAASQDAGPMISQRIMFAELAFPERPHPDRCLRSPSEHKHSANLGLLLAGDRTSALNKGAWPVSHASSYPADQLEKERSGKSLIGGLRHRSTLPRSGASLQPRAIPFFTTIHQDMYWLSWLNGWGNATQQQSTTKHYTISKKISNSFHDAPYFISYLAESIHGYISPIAIIIFRRLTGNCQMIPLTPIRHLVVI